MAKARHASFVSSHRSEEDMGHARGFLNHKLNPVARLEKAGIENNQRLEASFAEAKSFLAA